jgi:hypothetical protein
VSTFINGLLSNGFINPAGGLSFPVGLAFDSSGDLYVGNNYGGTVTE